MIKTGHTKQKEKLAWLQKGGLFSAHETTIQSKNINIHKSQIM